MYTAKIRPSSHSADYTVVCTLPTVQQARKVAKTYHSLQKGKHAFLSYYLEEGFQKELEDKVRREVFNQDPKITLKVYEHLQQLKISITIPKGATEEILPLITVEKSVQLIKLLKALCPPPTRTQRLRGEEKLTFHYFGEMIYSPSSEEFYFGDRMFSRPENVKVHQYTAFSPL
jgi:hypothetical protein